MQNNIEQVPPRKKKKVAAKKGKKQVGGIVSADRGETTTVMMCMSASGQHLPPFMIFPRARFHDSLKNGAFHGTGFANNPSGYMTAPVFNTWFDHFLEHVRPSETNPVLLIIDGHSSHKNLAFVEKARDNHVTVLILPPHCSHRLQPLDVTFMGPFETYYEQAVDDLLHTDIHHIVNVYDLAELTKKAFIRAATTENATHGFSSTGIYPFNDQLFDESLFAPSLVSDQPAPDELHAVGEEDEPAPSVGTSSGSRRVDPLAAEELHEVREEDDPISSPRTSSGRHRAKAERDDGEKDESPANLNRSFGVSPSDIVPLPKISGPRATKRKRQTGKTAILTSDESTVTLKKALASRKLKS